MIKMKTMPLCTTKQCPRKDQELFVYKSDNNVNIGICYACGRFDGMQTDPKVLQSFVFNTEMVLELIQDGLLIPVNQPRKIYK